MGVDSTTLRRLAAVALLLGIAAAATGVHAGAVGGRTRGYDAHRQLNSAGSPATAAAAKNEIASNCTMTSIDRTAGGQRVWTQHGVVTVGSHIEKVPSMECR
jgi:hypothetical protein